MILFLLHKGYIPVHNETIPVHKETIPVYKEISVHIKGKLL